MREAGAYEEVGEVGKAPQVTESLNFLLGAVESRGKPWRELRREQDDQIL